MSQTSFTIGYLTSSDRDSPTAVDAFRQFERRLEELGQELDFIFTIEHRSTEGSQEGFSDLATQLVQVPVDIIVVGDSRAIPIAKQATSTIPIVMAISGDVVGLGLVDSLEHPGGNLTGLTDLAGFLSAKRLELVLQVLPHARSVAVIRNFDHPGIALAWSHVAAAAHTRTVDLIPIEVADLESSWPSVDALMVLPDPATNLVAEDIVNLAADRQVPALYATRLFVEIGGLMYYGASRAAMFRRAAEYVCDILVHDEPPEDKPIEGPPVLELAVNVRTAKALGIRLPQVLLG